LIDSRLTKDDFFGSFNDEGDRLGILWRFFGSRGWPEMNPDSPQFQNSPCMEWQW